MMRIYDLRKRWATCAIIFVLALSAWAQEASIVKEIEVRGLKNVNRDLILSAMSTKIGQPFAQAQLDQDKHSIEETGFFQAVDVRAREIDQSNWAVVVEVVEFPIIKEVRIVGNSVMKTEDIQKALENAPSLPIKPGNIYNLKSVQSAAAAIKKLYNDKGYFAEIEEFGPLPEAPDVINLRIVELTVKSISVQGANRTKPGVLSKLIKTKSGDSFNSQKWQDDMRRMWNTQWFESIDPMVRQTDEIGKIDLVVDVKEARTGMVNVGLQVDPRSRIAGLLRFSEANFRGTGQSVGLGYIQSTSGGGASVDFDYANPFMDHRDTALNLSLYSRLIYRFSNTFGGGSGSTSPTSDRYFERRTGGTVSLTRPVQRKFYFSGGLRWERIKTSNLNATATNAFIQQDGDVGSLSLAALRNRRDVDIEPSNGDWLRFMVEPGYAKITDVGGATSNPSLIGNHNFARSQVEYRLYMSPGQPKRKLLDEPRKVIAFRAKYGAITGTVPFFEQFFVGGSDSIRGYSEDRFWGKQMAVFTLEYRHPVQKAFNAILFADYGGAWGGYGSVNQFTQSSSAAFKLGYGLGFSFRTPLGPIRLDFGFNQEGGSRTHFQIGTSF